MRFDMRKYFILIIILAMTYTLSAQENTAPFGGKLVEKHNIFSVVRSDDSKLTKLNGSWYLARESQSEDALPVPKYILNPKYLLLPQSQIPVWDCLLSR